MVVTDTVASYFTLQSVKLDVDTVGTCTVSGQKITCTIPRMASTRRAFITIVAKTAANAPNPMVNTAQVVASETDPDGTNNQVRMEVLLDVPMLTKPILVSPGNGVVVPNDLPTLSWQSVSGATTYEVRLSTENPSLTTIANQGGVNFKLTKPLIPGTYFWQVRASGGGRISPWSEVFSLIVESPIDAVPLLNVYATATPLLTWGISDGAVSYEVQVSASSTFLPLVFTNNQITSDSVTLTALADGVYFWRVRAKGGNGVWSTWSEPQSFFIQTP